MLTYLEINVCMYINIYVHVYISHAYVYHRLETHEFVGVGTATLHVGFSYVNTCTYIYMHTYIYIYRRLETRKFVGVCVATLQFGFSAR